MKYGRTILVAALPAIFVALPYLFIYYKPSAPDQLLSGIAPRFVANNFSDVPVPVPAPTPAELQRTAAELASSDIAEGSSDVALDAMLASAATPDKTVIITTLNQAWAAKDTMIDIFLDSFHRGENITLLLNHLVIVALDQTSFDRCQDLHRHCFMLKTPGVDFSGSKAYMSEDFLKMMWRRMSLLRTILEMGYNFVFTDADILWVRNPFDHFAKNTDFQVSCDRYKGNPWSTAANRPNSGYIYTQSNNRTIAMFRHWCKRGEQHPLFNEQILLDLMLRRKELLPFKVGIRFLETDRFSGFCQKSNDMTKVVTIHANCCTGMGNKIQDLHQALNDWEASKSLSPANMTTPLWHVPHACLHSKWPSPLPGLQAKPTSRTTGQA